MFNTSIAQISMQIWSNALYNSRGNQINIAQITFDFLLRLESASNYYKYHPTSGLMQILHF